MTTPGTIYVRFTAGSPIDPVGKYYGNSAWIPAMTIEAKPVTLAWAGTADRKPNDGGSVTAALPEGAVVAGDDVRLVVDGGGEQAEGRYTATARLEGSDAFKYSLQNASQPYVVGSPAPEPEPESPSSPAATTDSPATPEPESPTSPEDAGDESGDSETSDADDAPRKALPQTGDPTSLVAMGVAGASGLAAAAAGLISRRR